MVIESTDNQWFKAGDLTTLKEVLHPDHIDLNIPFSLAFAYLEKNEKSLLHTLKDTEIYFITKGMGDISLNEETYPVTQGDLIVVNPNVVQSLRNTGNGRLEFLCIVYPPWSKEREEIIE